MTDLRRGVGEGEVMLTQKCPLLFAVSLAFVLSSFSLAAEPEAGGKSVEARENARTARLVQGMLGVIDMHFGKRLLGPHPKITFQEKGRSGARTVRLVAQGINLEIDANTYMIISYLNGDLLEKLEKQAPKKNWMPPKKMLAKFMGRTDIFKTFGVEAFRKQFPSFEPQEYSPGGVSAATFIARRIYGKYKYLDERIVVRLSFDGKQLLHFGADFTPVEPENDKAKVSAAEAKVFLAKAIRESRRALSFRQTRGVELEEKSLTVDKELRYVHPNAVLGPDPSPRYHKSGRARLAYIGHASLVSAKWRVDLIVWIDAEDGKPLGGDYTWSSVSGRSHKKGKKL